MYKLLIDNYISQNDGILLLRDIIEYIEDYYYNLESNLKQPKNIKTTVSNYVKKKIKADINYNIIKNNPFSFIKKESKDIVFNKTKIADFLKDEIVHERDLHFHLEKFLKLKNINPDTIFHEISNKKSEKDLKWLHPDIVGYSLYENHESDVFNLSRKLGISTIYLYSFELKRDLNIENLKRYYFQAVSNSSWANFGYLVVENIDLNSDIMTEFKRLNNEFRIGLIKIDTKNIFNSKIIFESKKRDLIDREFINILVKNNSNFSNFIKKINNA